METTAHPLFTLPETSKLKALGFTGKNITSIAGTDLYKTPTNLAGLYGVLEDRAETLQTFMQAFRFKPSNISGMLNNCYTIDNLSNALDGLFSDETQIILQQLIRADRFSASNISCMMSSAGQHIGTALKELHNNLHVIEKLKAAGLSYDNISSMMSSAGQHIGTGLQELHKNLSVIEKLKAAGLSYDNISSMMTGAGKNTGACLKKLETTQEGKTITRLQKLEELIKSRVPASNIAQVLNGTARNPDRFAAAIDTYYDKIQQQLKDGTYVAKTPGRPAGSKSRAKVAATSAAAIQGLGIKNTNLVIGVEHTTALFITLTWNEQGELSSGRFLPTDDRLREACKEANISSEMTEKLLAKVTELREEGIER